jgi:hypothetical protein
VFARKPLKVNPSITARSPTPVKDLVATIAACVHRNNSKPKYLLIRNCLRHGFHLGGHPKDPRADITAEEIIARAPDIIIGFWCGKKFRPEKVTARPGLPSTRHSERRSRR